MAKITDVALIAGIGAGLYFLIQAGKGLTDTLTKPVADIATQTQNLGENLYKYGTPLGLAGEAVNQAGTIWDAVNAWLNPQTPTIQPIREITGASATAYQVEGNTVYPLPPGSTELYEMPLPLGDAGAPMVAATPTLTPRSHAECYGINGTGAYSIGDYQLCLEGFQYRKGY